MDRCTHALTKDIGRLNQHSAHGIIEPDYLIIAKAWTAAKGIDPGPPANLISIGIADASYKGLVGEYPFDLAPAWSETLAKEV
jgi:hypothetical protein